MISEVKKKKKDKKNNSHIVRTESKLKPSLLSFANISQAF